MYEDEEKIEDPGILLGQMCYDELEPLPIKDEVVIDNTPLNGQLDFDAVLNNQKIKPKLQQNNITKNNEIINSKIQKNTDNSLINETKNNIENNTKNNNSSAIINNKILTENIDGQKNNLKDNKIDNNRNVKTETSFENKGENTENNNLLINENNIKTKNINTTNNEITTKNEQENNAENDNLIIKNDIIKKENNYTTEKEHAINTESLENKETNAKPKQENSLQEELDDEKANEIYKTFLKYNEDVSKVQKRERITMANNEQMSFTGGNIIYKPLEDVLHDSMIPYTEHVVMDRALPRVEDGLKPVQRRILYAMYDMGLLPDKPYRKSATVVGECLGKYHPHGDSSVYDAAVRMAQDFSLREPLIDGHGNFGSIDGDGAAAYRYTEMKLKDLACELLRDIDKDTVHWSLNFDDRLKEPDTLPGRFPNLLVNGAYGIAVGVATNIPPHNLGEVIDAVVAYIDKPSIDTKGLMKYIKGPDFPTGASIIAGDELRTAYETGKGKIVVRANTEIETQGDKQNIVITDIPYQINKAQLLQKIAQLKDENKDKLSAIQEIRDESDRNGIRAVIRLKKDANAKAILDFLYKATNLQTTFGINMVAIAGGKPKQMSLLEIISYYVEYQRQVIYRRTKFDLDVCKERAHILEGLLIAIQNIDEVIKIIKKSESVSIAKQKLRERFLLSDKQATAILEMKLSRLVNLEVYKIKQELAELKIRIEELTAIYVSKTKQYEVVKKEILEIKKTYKSPRRTKLLDPNTLETEVIDEPQEVAVRDYMLAITANKTIKAIPMKNYNLAVRELGENSTLNEVHIKLLKAKSTDRVIIFTNKGNVFKTVVDNIPEAKWRERGTDLQKLDKNILHDEYPINIVSLEKEDFELASTNLVFVTANGMIKKSPLSEYIIAKSVFAGIKLKDKDTVVFAGESDTRFSLLLIAKNGMAVNIADDLEPSGRVTAGVKAMALDDTSIVNVLQVKKSGAVTVLTDKGYIKNVSIGEYELSSRNRKGLRITGANTGNIAFTSFGVVPPDVAVYADGKVQVIKSKYIPYDNRAGKGKQIIKDEFKGAFEPLS